MASSEEQVSETNNEKKDNAARIHQLWSALCLMQQEPGTTVTEYYTKFKSLVDELIELHECTCGGSKELAQREEDHMYIIHLFLGGLESDRYIHVKESILNTDPLPSLTQAFDQILREESLVMAERKNQRCEA